MDVKLNGAAYISGLFPSFVLFSYRGRWIKRHSCLFCSLHVNKMSRHLLRCHSTEPQVAKVLALPKGSIERRREWVTLLNKEDFEHNIKCFKGEFGKEHVITKYTSKNISVSKLLPCTKCKGLYQRKYLTDHIKKCLKISGEEKRRGTARANQCCQYLQILLPLLGHGY